MGVSLSCRVQKPASKLIQSQAINHLHPFRTSIRTFELSCSIVLVCIHYDPYNKLCFDFLMPLHRKRVLEMHMGHPVTFF